ncbi:MAG: RNA polymerase sigma factor [Lachnospiraceae bacterium]|jgi:RNA polymerase sigma factor, sigma-70 family|nr:RNA polymerase sigma factor [Lachnospiraceae bacterium]MCI9658574.1 RNA polymerase sigma factor [Lachnospiraceae bacterium]
MERFMELYQTVYGDLYRLAYYYMGNVQDAEDAVQDTVLSAYEHFGSLKEESSFRPWIFRILVNRCRRTLKRRRQREIPVEDVRTVQESEHTGPESQTEVLELLGILNEEERLIVSLTVFGGYKGREIARLLHRNQNTIRSKYWRALKKLEQEIMRGQKAETGKGKSRGKEVQG